MAILSTQVATAPADARREKRAWLYLRVSTPGQVHTDYNPEGISIPAQRDAGQRKAAELSATVTAEFIEPGRTATSIEKRPTFQEMLAAVRAPHLTNDRLHHRLPFQSHLSKQYRRGHHQEGTGKYSARVVSTVLDMGETPESAMVESIIHAVDQYQSQASGADITLQDGAEGQERRQCRPG